jgi:hypothetical protein
MQSETFNAFTYDGFFFPDEPQKRLTGLANG